MESSQPKVPRTNVAALSPIYETETSSFALFRSKESALTLLNRGFSSLSKQKTETGMSPTFMHPIMRAKLNLIHKNPAMFKRMQSRLREGQFHTHHQLLHMQVLLFFNELKVVEVREEIKSHVLVLEDTKSKSFRSSILDVTMSMLSPELFADDSTVSTTETCEFKANEGKANDSRWTQSWNSPSWSNPTWNSPIRTSPSPQGRKSFKLFGDNTKTASAATNTKPTFLFLPPVDATKSTKEYNLVDEEDCTESTTSASTDDDSIAVKSVSLGSIGCQ